MWVWFPEGRDNVVTGLRRGRLVETDDAGTQQKLKLRGLASEELKDVVRVLPFGFSSNAPVDSEGVLVTLGGRSDRALALGFEHKDFRQKNLQTGTAVLYDDQGNVIFVKGSSGIAIDAQQGRVYVKPAPGQNVYLGGNGDDGVYAKVQTVSGPAKNVLALIG